MKILKKKPVYRTILAIAILVGINGLFTSGQANSNLLTTSTQAPLNQTSETQPGLTQLRNPASSQSPIPAPGGITENASSNQVRPLLTAAQINKFLPERGSFTFPAPYNTQAIRLTNPSDCNQTDCVGYTGYSYWSTMNNSTNSNTLYAFVTLKDNGGPTLFSINKTTNAVTKLGPLFPTTDKLHYATGEGWYFSATQPAKLYVQTATNLLRYDVLSKTYTTVFDAAEHFNPDTNIWQTHSSNNDDVHSFTLKDAAYQDLGCGVYKESGKTWYFYPKNYEFDECQIDKSGRYLLIKENVDGKNGEDNRIIDLQTNSEKLILDENGAAGHSDSGFGYMIAADNWNNTPNAIRLWDLATDPLGPGTIVYHDPSWLPGSLQHISFSNHNPSQSIEKQFACGSGANANNGPRANEIVCFKLDGSEKAVAVAPVMTDMNATGGGNSYAKLPKGNLDPTGQYFMWTSNMGGSRLDAFIVKVPSQLLAP